MITDLDADVDFDAMTDDEVIAYLMRRCDLSRADAERNWREASAAVDAATGALFAACARGEIEATGINIETGKRETIPPHEFKAR